MAWAWAWARETARGALQACGRQVVKGTPCRALPSLALDAHSRCVTPLGKLTGRTFPLDGRMHLRKQLVVVTEQPELSLGLSGANAPPDDAPTSTPSLSFSLHPIGGFCGLTSVLPPPFRLPLEMSLGADAAKDAALAGSGLNTRFDRTVHCLAAEPDACLLRVSVLDAGEEVAYETMVLGRLRPGYRVLRLRS